MDLDKIETNISLDDNDHEKETQLERVHKRENELTMHEPHDTHSFDFKYILVKLI